jgi:hypothetical protein
MKVGVDGGGMVIRGVGWMTSVAMVVGCNGGWLWLVDNDCGCRWWS